MLLVASFSSVSQWLYAGVGGVLLGRRREEATHGDLGWGWGFLRCSLSNSFHSGFWSGHEFLACRRARCLAQSAALLCPSLQHILCAVTPVAQPSFYRFQSPNISYGPGEPEPESDLSKPGTELTPDTTRGLVGNSVPRFYIENLGHQQILLLGPNTYSCSHHD